MKRVLKWIAIIVGALLLLILLGIGGLVVNAQMRLGKTYAVTPPAVTIPTAPDALAEGQRLATIHCTGCHGENLAGAPVFDDPALGHIDASNLTPGNGGVGGRYTDGDWVRAIRHGIDANGKGLLIMPSAEYNAMNDADLGNLIAYLKTLPPVDTPPHQRTLTPLVHVLFAAGAMGNSLTAEIIDHTAARPNSPAPGANVEYGHYLATIGGCHSCHGKDLAGGPNADPGGPPGPNLTAGGELGGWSEAGFIQAMRTGVTPSGRAIGEWMPWKQMGQMNDMELKALWSYLQAQPKLTSAAQ
ncbi:MAG: cytochrome c [Anaerolineales bacterium]|nr:cytochrome c [Anaerolineales bacterium]